MTSRFYTHILVDESGNYLIDESGNNIVAVAEEETTGLHAQVTSTTLHAPKIEGKRVYGEVTYFLVDELGNYTVDELGNNIVAISQEYLILLNAPQTSTLVHT